MAVERWIRLGEVAAEVGSAALLAQHGARGDDLRQWVRIAAEPAEAVGVAAEAPGGPGGVAGLLRRCDDRGRLWWIGGRDGQARLGQAGQRGALALDEALGQGVG